MSSRRLTIPHREAILAGAFTAALAVALGFTGLKELQPDSYRLLYAGRWIAQHGLPHREMFTLAAARQPFADQQWLAELLSYETWRVGGYGGLALMMAGAFGLGYGLVAAMLRRRGVPLALSVAGGALALFGSLSLVFIRAQLLAIPLFALVLWMCLSEQADRPRRAVAMLAILVLWANLHGSVLIGAAVAAACLGWRAVRSRRPAVAGLALIALLTPLATPYGLHVLTYYSHMIGNQAVGLADIEWDPPAFGTLSFVQFALPLALAAAAAGLAVARTRSRPAPQLMIATLVAGGATSMAMRNGVWLGIAAATLTAESLAATLATAPTSAVLRRTLVAASMLLALVTLARLEARNPQDFEHHAPLAAIAAAADYSSAHPCARILGDTRAASALLWLRPRLTGRVGFDGELEAYPEPALRDWVSFQQARGGTWLQAAHGYGLLLGTGADEPALTARLRALPGGRLLAADRTGVAVVREPSACV